RERNVTGVQTCARPICARHRPLWSLCLRTAVTMCPGAVGPLPRGVFTAEGRPCLPALGTCLGHPGLLRIPHQGVQKRPTLVLLPPRCTGLRRPRDRKSTRL